MHASVWMRRLAVSSYIALTLTHYVQAQQVNEFSLPAPKLVGHQKRQLWATWYHLFPAKEIQSGRGYPLIDTHNKPISVNIPPKEWCLGAMSGAINVTSAKGKKTTYNYIDSRGPVQVNCRKHVKIRKPWVEAMGRSRFKISDAPYGDGFKKAGLVPFRTIATDKHAIPLGSVLFVPSARGNKITLPDGKVAIHDGYFYVGDKGGGGVKGNHIDVFSGPYVDNPFPAFVKHTPSKTFEAFIINDKSIQEKLLSMHQRHLPQVLSTAKRESLDL